MIDPDYACALSGLFPTDNELVADEHMDEDLGDLPVGWTEVRLRRRVVNPDYLRIQRVKNTMLQAQLVQEQEKLKEFPDLTREQKRSLWMETRMTVTLQVEAMFAALEVKTPPFLVDEEMVHIAPATRETEAQGLTEAQLQLFEMLDVAWVEAPEDGGDGGEEAPVEAPVEASPEEPVAPVVPVAADEPEEEAAAATAAG